MGICDHPIPKCCIANSTRRLLMQDIYSGHITLLVGTLTKVKISSQPVVHAFSFIKSDTNLHYCYSIRFYLASSCTLSHTCTIAIEHLKSGIFWEQNLKSLLIQIQTAKFFLYSISYTTIISCRRPRHTAQSG